MAKGKRAALACLLGLAALFARAATKPPQRPPKPGGATARVVFELPRLDPKKQKPSGPRRIDARAGTGSMVKTGKSTATLFLGRNVTLRLKEHAVLRFRELRLNPKTQRLQAYIQIVKGTVLFKVKGVVLTHSTIKVRTPVCVAGVRGTVFVVAAEAPARTKIEVLEGKLATYSAAGLAEDQEPPADALPVTVTAGKELDYDAEGPAGKPEPIEPEELARDKAWEKEAEPAETPEKAGTEGATEDGGGPAAEPGGEQPKGKPAGEEGSETPAGRKEKEEAPAAEPGTNTEDGAKEPAARPAEKGEKEEEPSVTDPAPSEPEPKEPEAPEDSPEKPGPEDGE